MERLIDADVLKKELIKALREPLMDIDEAIDVVVTTIDDAPTVDPVKHGHWVIPNKEKTDRPLPECSCCGWYVDKGGVLDFSYCPNCGCKMDEVKDVRESD